MSTLSLSSIWDSIIYLGSEHLSDVGFISSYAGFAFPGFYQWLFHRHCDRRAAFPR